MPSVELPALNGTDPLGFLAALGLLRVLTSEHAEPVALSFSDTTGRAILHSDLASTHQIAETLGKIVQRAGPDTAIVGVDDRFPLRRPSQSAVRASEQSGGEKDPMRVPRDQYPQLAAKVAELGDEASRWLNHLVTDLAVDGKGQAALTPYCAPAGKQSLRSFFATPLQAVRAEPAHLHEALSAWRRVDNFTGEYLDYRVIRDAADHPHGKSTEAGVPGATWLATQALRLLRLTGDGDRVTATLWHRHNRRPVMIWPLWAQPLNQTATQALLEHPALAPAPTANLTVAKEPLRQLGVFTVAAAERRPLRDTKSAGVLLPLPVGL
ncbi:type I-G CRISPR-associated protein, Cas3-extension family [Actinomadura rupiterrae]|uniref:type I-G CRISPR-associated protein, Cas3-extension family n=1 Tax=Actinomadura rupiterrae TaxID=559627 RepID=UPI0020A43C1B|nr:hypothetical protein [Actinomadura rupiterrae]MCP2340168.1 hypothetical protein [Actinomadura rupiterrae]